MSKKPRSPEAEDEERRQYEVAGTTLKELDEEYPYRPKNHSRTWLFSELYQSLFDPLNENKKKPTGPNVHRAKLGPHGPNKTSPHEQRRSIIEQFFSRWRTEVGNDIYPAMRLIIPSQDRDRTVYGLKENAIGKLLVKILKIDRNSEDGKALLRWKDPGQRVSSMTGDFSGRCHEVISRRPIRMEPGNMTIADVNEMLDKLSAASGEKEQMPILESFYHRMNADELMWLIRIILKQMKVGATERTFLNIWHADGDALFNVSSNLRRVCWQLHSPDVNLDGRQSQIELFQIFQPQLAQFQFSGTFQKMVDVLTRSHRTETDNDFWIEEKLDGERMQMHMQKDDTVRGGMRFAFWSRQAKNYTYLYGNSFFDEKSSLTRHLRDAFVPEVTSIILDGEMVTWDMDIDKIMNFGTLKTVALAAQKNPFDQTGPRPVYRVFDILYLNDNDLRQYMLRDRRQALEKVVKGVHRRLELHPHETATSPDVIEPALRTVVASASEGLVLKDPRSVYTLNSRNDDWIKVKPEYMDDLGENVDVVVIGGYYGSGRRGGRLSSFLCGLRPTKNDIRAGANPETCYSFCKVGGGFKGEDYQQILEITDGKWHDWNKKNPPSEYVVLGGGEARQAERPDKWIRASDSFVISVKAASATTSDQFAKNITLRFPRFKGLRLDRTWDSALDYDEFVTLRKRMEEANEGKTMKMEKKRARTTKRVKKEVVIAGQDAAAPAAFEGPQSHVFKNLEFCVLSDSTQPRKSKAQVESIIKENGGTIKQKAVVDSKMILLANKKVVKVASLIKAGEVEIIRPKWVYDCLAEGNNFVLPYEPGHLLHGTDGLRNWAQENVDEFGDSYARNLSLEELRELLTDMPKKEIDYEPFDKQQFVTQLEEHGHDLANLKCHMFRRNVVYFAVGESISPIRVLKFKNWVRFGGGIISEDLDDISVSHVVVFGADGQNERDLSAEVRATISRRTPIPRVVTQLWLGECWKESTLLDEERYVPA
ncbi:DNA ligase [Apiospora phragmitis]|uniref:DNA ligase n=1 Tax=Apiospora phragmitis TaxID=2905665 RepID=A0ABR1W193_9PEZI